MYFKDKLDSINAYICISVHTVSGNIARIAAILPESLQYCQNSGKTNLHAKSSMQCCGNIARNWCCNITAILLQYIARRLVFQLG